MKKKYFNPEIQVIKAPAGAIMTVSVEIGVDEGPADPKYPGGGDAKMDFGGLDLDFDEEE